MKAVALLAAALTALTTVAQATEIAAQPRMLVESFVSPGNKTYMVGLRSSLSESNFCAGLLITKKHVLSTTVCARKIYRETTEHPKASGSSYNFVIFELDREVKFSPVALANRAASAYAGKMGSAFGWNFPPTSKNVLLRQTSTIHSQATCKKAVIYEELDGTVFCAGGGSSAPDCRGLKGAIVVEREGGSDLALGLIVRSEGCADDGKAGAAGGYTDAFAAKAWIQQTAPGVMFE